MGVISVIGLCGKDHVVDHDLVVAKETVRHALRILDPEGVDDRLRHRLQRRQYKGRGPTHTLTVLIS